jgi:hypothetical protein
MGVCGSKKKSAEEALGGQAKEKDKTDLEKKIEKDKKALEDADKKEHHDALKKIEEMKKDEQKEAKHDKEDAKAEAKKLGETKLSDKITETKENLKAVESKEGQRMKEIDKTIDEKKDQIEKKVDDLKKDALKTTKENEATFNFDKDKKAAEQKAQLEQELKGKDMSVNKEAHQSVHTQAKEAEKGKVAEVKADIHRHNQDVQKENKMISQPNAELKRRQEAALMHMRREVAEENAKIAHTKDNPIIVTDNIKIGFK